MKRASNEVKLYLDSQYVFDTLQRAVGVPLTETEERYLRWLARYDKETIETFISLFEKIRKD